QALQSKFGLKITFRQLLSDQSNFKALAEYIDAKLSPNALAEPPSTAAVVASPVPIESAGPTPAVPAEDPAIERLMREQLQAMNQLFANQLGALRTSRTDPALAAATNPGASAHPVPESTTASSAPVAQPQKTFKPFGPYKPVQQEASGELTERQRKYLQSLMDRYTTRTA